MGADLPPDMRGYVPAVEQTAMLTLRAGNYSLAERLLQELLEAILKRQEFDKRRIHKGSFYHNIGFSLAMQSKLVAALRYFLLAYIEDCINAQKTENEADNFPAARVLKKGFSLGDQSLDVIKDLVKSNRQTPANLLNPETTFNSFLEKSGISENELLTLCVRPPTPESVQTTLVVNLTADAANFLDELASKRKEELIQRAITIAQHRGSKIVTGADIREARKQLEEETG